MTEIAQTLSVPLLSLVKVSKWLGGAKIVDAIDLDVQPSEFVTLLGPSGCGKTTTLRCITGILGIDDGAILLRGVDVATVPTHRRQIGKVFQSFALFPHMTVAENVAFPLRVRKCPPEQVARSVEETLALVQLTALAARYPREMSGGQQQRVGLARAIVYRPDLILFDEPLSNLDAKLRRDMRHEIRRLQRSLGFAAIYVTHDQEEALALSDRIAVMNRGVIEHIGTPEEVYARPRSLFVAGFLGNPNRLEGTIEAVSGAHATLRVRSTILKVSLLGAGHVGKQTMVVIRPEAIRLDARDGTGERNIIKCRVLSVAFLGERRECQVESDDGLTFNFYVSPEQRIAQGDRIDVSIPVDECRAYTST
jgi:ABC-type Fe3+/spermidine/putrescine transport system ATPase subunit